MKHLRQKKLSSLLTVAVKDLKSVARRKNCKINMSTWLSACNGQPCNACLAGSALLCELPKIANSFKDDDLGSLDRVVKYGGDELLIKQMLALNSLRQGYIESACASLAIEKPESCPIAVPVAQYYSVFSADSEATQARKFYASMRRLIKVLQKHGL